ncbi:MAG: hypothetical protein J7L23_02215 [Candidatus Diapherotrites archaeon]|nr:hypothetical protein [Candidatus Diapherotrites archaeon]
MVSKFCPKCGATDKPFFKGFCVDCYMKDHKLIKIPEEITVDECPSCLRLRLRGEWVTPTPSNLARFIKGKVKVKELEDYSISVRETRVQGHRSIIGVKIEGKLGGTPVEIFKEITFIRNVKQCDICAKKKTKYYKALIQLRPKSGSISHDTIQKAFRLVRNRNRAYAIKDREAEIFRFKADSHGIDVYLGSSKAAGDIVNALRGKFDAQVKKSSTLVGMDRDGRKKYRVTYSVRV